MQFSITLDNKHSSGIYAIRNVVSDKIYIGSAFNLNKRYLVHKSDLAHNKHANKHLQRSFNKYGPSAFVFELVELCEMNALKEREQIHIDNHFGLKCFNINPAVQVTGNNARQVQQITLISPSNKTINFNGTLREIAAQIHTQLVDPPTLGSCANILGQVLNKKKKHLRGWRLPENAAYNWKARSARSYHAKTWDIQLLGPEGQIIGPITNIEQFCRDHDILNSSVIHNLIMGRTRYANGWSIYSGDAGHPPAKNSKVYNILLVDPLGNTYGPISNLSKFARDHNLSKSGLQAIIWKKQQSHRGWKTLKNPA